MLIVVNYHSLNSINLLLNFDEYSRFIDGDGNTQETELPLDVFGREERMMGLIMLQSEKEAAKNTKDNVVDLHGAFDAGLKALKLKKKKTKSVTEEGAEAAAVAPTAGICRQLLK